MKKVFNEKKSIVIAFQLFILVFGVLSFYSAFSCEKIESNQFDIDKVTITFESNFDPLPPEYVEINLYGGSYGINRCDMESVSGRYIYDFHITKGQEYTFNIVSNNPSICKSNYKKEEWVASGSGIRAKEVKINDKVLDNRFLFDNYQNGANFKFIVNEKGEVVPGKGVPLSINEDVPSEIQHKKELVKLLPDDIKNRYANVWFSVIHDIRKGGNSKVEIESLKLYARLENGEDVLLTSEDYDKEWEGKLYMRYPYFDCSLDESFQWDMPAQLNNGKLVFYPSDITNRVWHGWCRGKWPQVLSNTKSLWVEAEIRITGNALMQIGVDIRESRHNYEGWGEYGVSDWFFATNEFQTIYFNKP